MSSHDAGAAAESLAAAHLERIGYRILARNVRHRGGELDLVAEQGGVLCFVEVRMRRSAAHGSAAESITPVKQRRVVLAARGYLAAHPTTRPCRFDVVLVAPGTPPKVEVIVDAFRAEADI